MAMAKKDATAKATQARMAKAKKVSARAKREWELACNTNPERGNVPTQEDIKREFSRRDHNGECGATKIVHIYDSNGEPFEYICIKRFKRHGHDFAQGNQLIEEIKCWQKLATTESADMLCPIFKYFTSKSDKVSDSSDTMKNNVVIIAQKAVYVSDAEGACYKAEQLNRSHGFRGETAKHRLEKLETLAREQRWWDAIHNCGNSGVIFDYSKNCYKAVFIDYAL